MNSSLYGGKGATGAIAQNKPSTGEKIPSGYKKYQMQNFTPEQMDLFRQMFQHVGPESYLSKLAAGDESLFNEMEAPAMRQFQGLQGDIASRFSGYGGKGSLGARRSSGFQNTMSQESSNFAQDLASKRQSLQQNAIKELMGLSHDLLGQKPYDQFLMEKQKSPWGSILGKLLGPIAGFAGDKFTGDKQYSGTQEGLNSSVDIIKALLGSGGGF